MPLQLSLGATQTMEAGKTAFVLTQMAPTATFTITPTGTVTPTPTITPRVAVTGFTPTQNLQSLQTQVSQLETQVVILRQTPLPGINPTVNNLDVRLSAIEQTILDNPGKAIEVVLMKKDFETLKSSYETDRENTQKDIERVYNLMLWLIGLTISILLGMGGLAISNIFARKPEEKSDEQQVVAQKTAPKKAEKPKDD